jgi:type VI secretion system secreted protein VgrG
MGEKVYLYVKTPLDGADKKFFLEGLEGEERISGLFHYSLRLKTTDNAVDFSQMVGKSITVTIEQYGGGKRFINGVVTGFRQGENEENITTYYAEIRPWFYRLTLTADSRIFQNKTVPQIIEQVFGEFDFSAFTNSVTKTYTAREYCVQYQETAFDFISRLMEDEGIFYYFEHTEAAHTLVFADDGDAHASIPGLSTARFRKVVDGWREDDIIDECSFEQQVIPNKYAAEDFHFETPETDLLTSVVGKEQGSLRVYEYPGGFTTTAVGDAVVKRRIEARELPQKTLKGKGYCRAFIAGYKFALEGHDRQDMNASYVLRRVSMGVDQERYTNTFEAFPADVPFRPPLTTRKPKIFGTQTAVVVGPKNEEIWPDKYGRVKVQFHWDQVGAKDEKSSCWVRVAQVWAGKSWGTLFIPRIGTEVIVSFLEGDPDRPIIIGTVYNATQTVPYTLPADKNKSTILTRSTKKGKAGNEIRFDDTKDSEELYFHAQKDMNIKVENDRTKSVLNDEKITIKKNRTATIEEANEKLTVKKGNRTVIVKKGKETHSVKGKRTLTVTGNENHTNKAKFTHVVKGNYTLKVKGNLTIDVKGKVTIKSGSSFSTKAGTSITNKAGTALTNKSGTSLTNKAGTSLTNKASASLTNKAGASMTNKASASQTVDGGGMLTLKGGIVKVN